MRKVKITYVEPADYFPKEIRKKYKLGEYAEEENESTERKKKDNDDLRKVFKGK